MLFTLLSVRRPSSRYLAPLTSAEEGAGVGPRPGWIGCHWYRLARERGRAPTTPPLQPPQRRTRPRSRPPDDNRRTRMSSKEIREAVSDRGRGVRSRGERPPVR